MIKSNQITPDTIVCIERKQYGNNLGMQDVITLADILKYNEASLERQQILLPEYIQDLPIYSDALLYNAARDKDIKVIGIEGKSLAYSKESSYYTQAREEYMMDKLIGISQLEKKSIFLVGSSHIESLKSLFEKYKAEAKYLYELKKVSPQFVLAYLSRDQLAIAYEDHDSLVIKLTQADQSNAQYIKEGYIDILKSLYAESNIFESFFSAKILDDSSIRSYLLNYVYEEKLLNINTILAQEYIISSSLSGMDKILQKSPLEWSKQDFRKIYLVTHPDKGGKSNDFRLVKEFEQQTRFQRDLDNNLLVKAFEKLLPSMQEFISRISISFKLLDTAINGARFIYEPSVDHAKLVIIDTTYLYSIYNGVNGYSSIINAGDMTHKLYKGEYIQALQQVTTIAAYMVLPSVLNYIEVPYIGLLYNVAIAGFNSYSAIYNTYSFYLEYGSVSFNLGSYKAYKDSLGVLANSQLQHIYDFSGAARKYEFILDEIKYKQETLAIEEQLLAVKEEFAHKLYDYIYAPLLGEKYSLLNQVLQGNITEKDAEALKAKHIAITLHEQSYEHCMEIKDIENNGDKGNDIIKEEYYYCYNKEQQILDHVMIGESREYIEIIERL